MSPRMYQTMGSGLKFESELVNLINQHTDYIWHNIRIQTLLTQSGTTQIDILFVFKGIVFIIEAKNVSAIIGEYGGSNWSFIGSQASGQEVREYSKLNVITQNNIHVRSFKDAFFATFGEWPVVVPAIVVPNNCQISEDISSSVYTMSQLDTFLNSADSWPTKSNIHRRVAGLLANDKLTILRPDFVMTSQGLKKEVFI